MSSQTPISDAPGSPAHGPISPPNPEAVTPVGTQIIDSHSSPVKPGNAPTYLSDLRKLSEATDKSSDANFVRDHLSDIPSQDLTWWDSCADVLAMVRATKAGHEVDTYPSLCALLNRISEHLYGKCCFTPFANQFLINNVMVQHHWIKLSSHRTRSFSSITMQRPQSVIHNKASRQSRTFSPCMDPKLNTSYGRITRRPTNVCLGIESSAA
jgi:hypothetical protein